ncbi:MAG: PAS domain-containing protein [Dysgonamonadaceae bacterium]|nr:PAS domain-containing protein [Dysgonamonadaceae bacterium]MDD3357090.1 PAS domain-containing protein [Dysgonamonadaceae bacterium]
MDNNKKYSVSVEGDLEMKKHLNINIDDDRIKKMLEIKLKVFNQEMTPADARKLVNETFDTVSAEEFAYGEQYLFNAGVTDEIMTEGMDDILDVFKDVFMVDNLNLPKGHPIQTYADEATALEHLLLKMEQKLKGKFIKNEWLDLYSQLSEINTHFSRKQHQLFSALERKGFDRPSKIMWTFDDRVRDAIKDAYNLLEADKDEEFINAQPQVIHLVRDILDKEREVLYPTSLKLISDDEFAVIRKGDDEIGYCLIENPPAYRSSHLDSLGYKKDDANNLLSDLKDLLVKHGLNGSSQKDEVLNVSNGKLTLEQINLIYKHMQIDLSYVDENDIVKFYTDSKHRVFPRSPGVIGREVQNCHPRESLSTVNAIIDAFRKGEQDEAEFWIDRGDKFIYIVFNAVRDDEGNFKGVLEMMQDVTHIRSLKGSRRLLSWENSMSETYKEKDIKTKTSKMNSEETVYTTDVQIEISPKTVIGTLISQYPFIKDFLVSLSSDYSRLTNPVVFKTMKNIATLDMVSKVGGFEVDHLIKLIKKEIEDKS